MQAVRGESSREAKYAMIHRLSLSLADIRRSFKVHIVCFLSSHILCWKEDEQRVALLGLMSGISHSAKLGILWPLLKTLSSNEFPEALTRLLLTCFDQSVGGILNDKQGEFWNVFEALVIKSIEESGMRF